MPSIDAHVTRVEQDTTGWFRIHTDDEQIKRLDTKQKPLADEANQLLAQRVLARIEYSEREGNMNPNTGKPFLNRYYEKGTALGDPPQAPEIPVVQQTRATTAPAEAWRICLSAGGKLAVQTLPMLAVADRTFDRQKMVATAWAEFFYFTQPPERPSFDGSGQFQTPSAARAAVPAAADDPFPPGY